MKMVIKITTSLFFLLSLSKFLLYRTDNVQRPQILGEKSKSNSVEVTATLNVREIRFKVYPEKRIPKINNWSTIARFQIKDPTSGAVFLRQTPNTNQQGFGTVYPSPSEIVPPGLHSVLIKGFSHLAKRYDRVEFKHQYETYDFTPYGDLLAGDTHHSNDNFINSLDVSTLISKLSTGDYKNDLNQDTKVNSLDLSNQIFNLSKVGDF